MSFVCNSESIESLKCYFKMLETFLRRFCWLNDAYVLDFFTDEHWHRLPSSWQSTLNEMDLNDLCKFMTRSSVCFNSTLPLSLLAFRSCTFALTWPRTAITQSQLADCLRKLTGKISTSADECSESSMGFKKWKKASEELSESGGQHKYLWHGFRRHVKPKKQHEILRCAEVVCRVHGACQCSHVLDVGSGRGHLSRYLGFNSGLNVISVEGDGSHTSGAEKFDSQTFEDIQKKSVTGKLQEVEGMSSANLFSHVWHPPRHINFFISPSTDSKDLLKVIFPHSQDNESPAEQPSIILLGLHTCGNLASTMLRLFVESPEIRAIVSVGCCYMKLDQDGFPLSNMVNGFSLSYEAKEVSCHAFEQYVERIKGGTDSLKIHCYRATLEVLIQKYYPDLKHIGLRSLKHSASMSFAEYAAKALGKQNISIPCFEYDSSTVLKCLSLWKQVVIFYSLRLMIAPLIESFILLDRMLFLYQKGFNSCLVPVFDPSISPRNHMLISAKTDSV